MLAKRIVIPCTEEYSLTQLIKIDTEYAIVFLSLLMIQKFFSDGKYFNQ